MKEYETLEQKRIRKVREKLERLLDTKQKEEIFIRNIRKLLLEE